jgi:hypothetical protein
MKFLVLLFCLIASVAKASYFANTAQTIVSASVGTSSSLVLDADPYRVYLLCQNQGDQIVSLKFGSANSSVADGIKIPGGGNWEIEKGMLNSVYMISASGTQTVVCYTAR